MISCVFVSSEGSNGGLAMLRDDASLKLFSFSKNRLDMEVEENREVLNNRFFQRTRSKKSKSILVMNEDLAEQTSFHFPWLCLGDFNEILWSHEKTGYCSRRESRMESFRTAIED